MKQSFKKIALAGSALTAAALFSFGWSEQRAYRDQSTKPKRGSVAP